MTTEELEIIIGKHEMQRLELKESFGGEAIETACAFANAGGGFIVIGVDNDGRPSKQALRAEALRDYENRIATATEPSVAVDAEKVEWQGREVAVLRVQENPLKPVAAKGRCFVRKGSVNHQMTPAVIAECHLKSTGGSMDSVLVPGAAKEDLDMGAVRRYMERAAARGRRSFAVGEDPWEVLLKLEWVRSASEITRAAWLLFGKEPQRKFSQAIIHAGAFKGNGAVILDSHDAKGNIQDQLDEAMAFVQRNIRCALVVPPGRTDHVQVWDYPLEAVRETIANALCHRDYGSPHDIQIKVFEDGLVVSSPGQLPFDMPMELLMDPRHASRPRNKIIAQAFFDMGLIEHYGRGITRIQEECARNGNPSPVWHDRYGEFVTEYKPRKAESRTGEGPAPSTTQTETKTTQTTTQTADPTTQTTTQTPHRPDREISPVQRKILSYLSDHPTASRREIAEHLQNITEDGVKYHLARLQALDLLHRTGPDFGGRWEVVSPVGD